MSTNSKPTVTRSAICNCKQVEISVTGVDKGAVLCHCPNCQRASGSAFAHNHRFSPGEYQIVKGEKALKQYADNDTKSGNTLNRHFCSNCGCPMFLTNSAFKGFVVLHGGSLQGEKLQPSMNLFKDNIYHWVGDLTGKSKL